jgi:two-component system LytT family sensor kinase
MLGMPREGPLRFPSFWPLQFIGWVCFYLVGIVGSIPDIFRQPGALRGNTVRVGAMFLGSCVLHPLCRALLRRSPSWLAYALRAAGWSMVLGAAAALASMLVLQGAQNMSLPNLVGRSVQFGFVLFLWSSVYLSIKQWQQSVQERERLLRAETEAREARLSALRYQLNPHFLFNSLNAVSTLVLDGDTSAATQMLAQIGELLRTSLDNEIVPEMALAQEIAFTERYLAIEQTRLGERLLVDLAIAPESLDALVPSMLLQPLVENAVRHGVAPMIEGGKVTIESAVDQRRLRMVIRNSGSQRIVNPASLGKGIGLSNTAERLRTLYGTDHKFLLEWPPAGGCEVTVEIPYRKAAQRTEASTCAL